MTEHHKKHGSHDEPEVELDFEPEEELGDLAAANAKLKKLKAELTAVKKERQEYLDGWQRAKADAINAKKEAAAESQRMVLKMKEGIMEELVPALDSFDMAAGSPAWEAVDAGWRSGIEHIRNQLLDVLSRNGIERFGKIGEQFSPHLHDAVEERDDMPGEPGSILRVLRYGYKAGERVLRPAQVVIKSHA
jgi:molecular chaperone GrpE